jgi:ornithine cyclodeaminase
MLYLGEKDILEAAGFDELMDTIEDAYFVEHSGEYEMPPRMHVNNGDNTVLYMPCFLNSIFGTKILTLFPGNASKQKPVIEGLVLLNDVETGTPLAIIDGAKLTAVRTGAVGGVGIRHTASISARTVGLIGAGVQGFHQVLFACRARPVARVNLFDSITEKASALAAKLGQALPGVSVEAVNDVNMLLEGSEIVITATPAAKPVLPDDKALLKGKHYLAIGSYKPDMRELPASLYALVDKVFIDTGHGLEESGDLITPLQQNWISREQIFTFAEHLHGTQTAIRAGETTLFKSVGMALFDIVIAELIYRKALQKNIGQKIRV